jgi:hypothetical protein
MGSASTSSGHGSRAAAVAANDAGDRLHDQPQLVVDVALRAGHESDQAKSAAAL